VVCWPFCQGWNGADDDIARLGEILKKAKANRH
jgi:hypothetical protein